jgi:transglutaminase-like putative cysteine protease
LTITAEALVDVKPPAEREAYPPDPRGTWEELDALVADQDYYEMLLPSRYVSSSAALEALCKELRAERRATPYNLALELTQSVHHAFSYDRDITKVDSPIEQAIESRRGVCQDFTHVLLGLLRHVGIPCRYVSGYLFRAPNSANGPVGRSSHAWAEALIPHCGWVGLDSSFGGVADERHIRTCIGRDYGDVPPTKGVYRGGAGPGELSYAVQVHLPEELLEEDRFRPLT